MRSRYSRHSRNDARPETGSIELAGAGIDGPQAEPLEYGRDDVDGSLAATDVEGERLDRIRLTDADFDQPRFDEPPRRIREVGLWHNLRDAIDKILATHERKGLEPIGDVRMLEAKARESI